MLNLNTFPAILLAATLSAQGTSSLPGMVRAAAGKPISGVEIRAYDLLDAPQLRRGFVNHSEPVVQTESGANGRFVLRGLPGAGACVVVEKPGYYVHTLPFSGSVSALVVDLEPSGFVAGQVVGADGKPREASVTVFSEGSQDRGEYKTDGEGRFRFTHRWRGRYMLQVRNRDMLQPARTEVFDGPKSGIRVELPGVAVGPRIRLRAQTGGGEPVREFRACAHFGGGRAIPVAMIRDLCRIRARTTVSGEAVLPASMVVGRRMGDQVLICADGFVPRSVPFALEELKKDPGNQEIHLLTIDLARGGSVVGTVVDDRTNTPLADLGVELASSGRVERTFRTGKDGTFAITGLAHAEYELRVRIGGLLARTVAVEGRPGKRVEAGVLKIRRMSVQGSVQNWPPGATLLLQEKVIRSTASGATFAFGAGGPMPPRAPQQARQPVDERFRVAPNENGDFTFENIVRGRYELVASLPQPVGRAVEVPLGNRRLRSGKSVDLGEFGKLVARIEGRLRFVRAGIPLSRILVAARPQNRPRFLPPGRAGDRDVRCRVGRDGRYQLQVSAGRYRLHVIDLATGVTLHEANLGSIRAGATETADLKIGLGVVRIHLSAGDGAGTAPSVSHLAIAPESPRAANNALAATLQSVFGFANGLPVAPGTKRLELLLPVRPTVIRAWRGLLWMGNGGLGRAQPSGEVEFEPTLDAPLRVDLTIE